MVREHDDAVSTYLKTTGAPISTITVVRQCFYAEVSRQVRHLIGEASARKLVDLLSEDPVKLTLFKKDEQSRVNLIICLQRTGQL